MWDAAKSVAYLNQNAQDHSLGRCAEYVRKAVEAGGVLLVRHTSAKDYGSSLLSVGFHAVPGTPTIFVAGDVAVIQPIPGHPHGHMAMFNAAIWVSDFKQYHGPYPGPSYRKLQPSMTIYRYLSLIVAPPVVPGNSAAARLA